MTQRFLRMLFVLVVAIPVFVPALSCIAEGRGLRIITSFLPMHVATLNIVDGVEGLELSNLTRPTMGCLHDYQLSTDEMRRLVDADVLVANGAGMESFLDRAVAQNPKLKVVLASRGFPLMEENGVANPHIWLAISGAVHEVREIAARLSEIDSRNSAKYKDNAARYSEKLENLRATMIEAFRPIRSRDIVTFHEAFPYFAREFGFKVLAVIEREPGSDPTPQELVRAIRIIRENAVKVIFVEPQYSSKSAQAVAKETGAKVLTLDPVVTGIADKDLYLKAMKENARVLTDGLL